LTEKLHRTIPMAKYDFDDAIDNDQENNKPLKLEPPCMIRVTLDGLFASNSEWGQSLGIPMQDATLVDGIFTKGESENSFDVDNNTGSLKVLSWDAEMSVPEITADTTPDDLPNVVQRNYVGNTYKYEVLAARLEEDKDVGNPSVPEEEPELGNVIYFAGATDNGPKSATKTLAKILSAQGSDVVIDEDSQDAWLDEDVALRSDLMGREVIIAMTKRTADETGRTFHHPFVLDGKTRVPIFTNNEVSDDEPEEDDEEEVEESDEPERPEDLQSFFDTCNDLSIHSEEAVTGLLDEMLNDGDVSEESVDEYGRDEIIADLTQ